MRNVLKVLLALFVLLVRVDTAHSQTGAPWSTEIGAGLAMTNGNSDTNNINLSVAVVHDPKARNVFRFNGLYLRGDKDGSLIINQTSIVARDEINLSDRTFVFFQNAFLKDTFKNIRYLVSPTAGVGYKIINTDAVLLAVDTGLGGVWEKDVGQDLESTGAYNAGQRLVWKFSPNAAVTQSIASLWKTNNWGDSLHNFSAGIAAVLTQRTQVKLEFLDTFKNRPALPTLKKNDTTFITSLVVKF
jgi:putative salt-induced outer membrane protein YdiY